MQRLSFVIALAALVLGCVLWFRSPGSQEAHPAARSEQVQAPSTDEEEHEEEEEHIEVAVYMGRIQTYHQKLWASGEAGNSELAAFYLHEMEEAMEEIADGHVIEDGIDVSAQMRAHGLSMVESFEQRLKKEGLAAIHQDAAVLANTCNSCHVACGYPFIRVQVPTSVNYPNQDFTAAK